MQTVKSEVVEALLNGCASWTLLKIHNKLRTVHHRKLLRIHGSWCRSRGDRIFSYNDVLQRTGCKGIDITVRAKLQWAGTLARMSDHRLLKRIMSGKLEDAGQCARGPTERVGGLCGR